MYNGAQCTESMKRWMIRTLLCSCKCNVVTDPSIWKFITSLVNCLTLRARLMERRLKCSERWPNMHCIFCPSVLIELLLSMWCLISAVVELSNRWVLMEDPQLTNIKSARQMVWRLKCSERWSNTCAFYMYIPSQCTDELLLSTWYLISWVKESSNSINGRSSTDQHWKFQTDGVKVEVQWKVVKCAFYFLSQCKVIAFYAVLDLFSCRVN